MGDDGGGDGVSGMVMGGKEGKDWWVDCGVLRLICVTVSFFVYVTGTLEDVRVGGEFRRG